MPPWDGGLMQVPTSDREVHTDAVHVREEEGNILETADLEVHKIRVRDWSHVAGGREWEPRHRLRFTLRENVDPQHGPPRRHLPSGVKTRVGGGNGSIIGGSMPTLSSNY